MWDEKGRIFDHSYASTQTKVHLKYINKLNRVSKKLSKRNNQYHFILLLDYDQKFLFIHENCCL